jgi:hypothetical protein
MHEKILLTKAISNKIALARLYKSDTTGLDIIVGEILTTARTLYRDYQTGKLSEKEITGQRPVMEAQLLAVLHNPPLTGWPE